MHICLIKSNNLIICICLYISQSVLLVLIDYMGEMWWDESKKFKQEETWVGETNDAIQQ